MLPLTVLWSLLPMLVGCLVLAVRAFESWRRPAVGQLFLLCEAVGGPCDGRMWWLPEAAPMWLSDGTTAHRYCPDGSAMVGVRYRYAPPVETIRQPLVTVRRAP